MQREQIKEDVMKHREMKFKINTVKINPFLIFH